MSKHTWRERLIAVLCIIAILLSCPFAPVSAEAAETGTKVTATTNASVKQGSSAYCYVYIDSLESLSTLEVTVHFDPAVVSVTGFYNQVSALLYDASAAESTLQYTYIFDGNGANTKTQLFYFEYTVLPTAPIGDTYFDVVVGDAYDASFETLPVSGSRCAFRVAQTMNDLTCSVSGTSAVNTAVDQEFTLTYQFSTASIASGAAVIRYDPELFALVEVEQGGFLEGKLTDINTSLSGAVYLSFLGTAYGTQTQFLTVRFQTLKNVSTTDNISLTLTDLYDLELNSIACGGYITAVRVSHDSAVDETAPRVYLQETYDAQTQKLTVRVCLEENSHLGAGDFVLGFDTARLAYASAEKGYSPTFFNINDKNIDEGLLKFSVISMTDQTEAATMLTATFDVIAPCADTPSQLTISGSGLADHLTNAIVLNFAGCTAVTEGHTPVTDAAVAPTCLDTGLTEGDHCDVCQKVLLAQQIVPALGHDAVSHEALAPTCTEIGWEAYVTCSRCDYTTYVEIPANGHTFDRSVCTVCGAAQEAQQSWDISADGDGSLTAQLYANHDGTYELQITGSGAMLDFGSSSMPWNGYQALMTSVRLPEGLTTVGDYAFYGCSGLTELTLPEGLTVIGDYAFYGCSGLTELTLPEGLTAIGDYAFYGCSALTELTLPESLQTIGNQAFCECTGLTRIQFNATQMADLGYQNNIFANCGIAGEGITVYIGSNVTQIPAYLFYLYSSAKYSHKLTQLVFAPDSVCQSIGARAFSGCKGLTELTLPESLTAIGNYAFYECKGLTALTLPENMQTIGNNAFYGCTGLTQIYFNAAQMPDLKKSNSVFIYCGNATEGITVTVGSQVTRIPAYLFYPHSSTSYAPKLKAVTFAPDSVCQSIGSNAFRNGAWLTELTLPESLQTIDHYAFYNCTGLQTITFSEGLQTIGSYAFVGCAGLTALALPQSLQTIGHYAFNGCTGLQTVGLPEGLQTLNSSAFNGCTGLTRIDFNAAQLADLFSGNCVFAKCGTAGEGITVNIGSNVTRIPAYLFYPTDDTGYSLKLQAVTFAPDSVCQSIGKYAFASCTGLTELALPESVQTIESYGFYDCTGLTELTLPEGLQTIGECAFYNCTGLAELTLPESLQTVGEYAFYNCTGLTRINFHAAQMTDLDTYNHVFSYCGSAGEGITVTVGSCVTRIPACLFYPSGNAEYAPNIAQIVFAQDSVCQSIGDSAFYGCAGLRSVVIPESVMAIERYAFYSCPGTVIGFAADALPATLGSNWRSSETVYYLNVEKIVAADEARYVICHDGTAVFAKYDGTATQYQVPEAVEGVCVTAIGISAFRNNATIEQVLFPDSVTQIQQSAFYNCSALKTVTIPENITRIGQYAFYNCTAVEQIAFHAVAMEDLAYQNYVFYNNGTATQGIAVTIGPKVTGIPDYLFRPYSADTNNPRITSLVFAENGVCQSIGYRAFCGLDHLVSIILPQTVTSIEDEAMAGCAKLTIGFAAEELPQSLGTNWSNDSGYYLDVKEFVLYEDATYVITNDNTAALGKYFGTAARYEVLAQVDDVAVTQIGPCAFIRNATLESAVIPDSVTAIGEKAFAHCTALTELLLPDSITAIGASAFYYCKKLASMRIPESVTRIGAYALYGCDKMTVGFAAAEPGTTLENGWSGSCSVYYDVKEFAVFDEATYVITNDNVAILGKYYGTAEQYTIPETVNGASVTTIGTKAFHYASALVSVSAPDTLTRIESYAFASCTGLKDFGIPGQVTVIGSYAFSGCVSLESITIPENVTNIGSAAFQNTYGLTQLQFNAIAANDLSSGNGVFYCAGQNGGGIRVTIGKQVTKIPSYLFDPNSSVSYQPKITQVVFEEGSVCRKIGNRAFAYNTNFPDLVLPEGLETIGTSAFAYTGISSIVIPASVTAIGARAFEFNTALTAVQLPEGVTAIEAYTFRGCTGLTAVSMPQALTRIGNDAFYDCGALTQVVIPEHVTSIIVDAFTYTGLKLVYICSGQIAANAGSATACGSLLDGVSTVIIRADIASVSTYITDNYPDTAAITYQGVDYISYSVTAHNWSEYAVLVPYIACQQDGCVRYICDDCGAFKDVTTFRHDAVVHEAQAVTCLEIGWDAYETCARCDYSTYAEIPALGHDLVNHEAQAVTCLKIGWDAYETCSRCDYSTYAEIPALGHDPLSHEAQSVTCLEIGWEAYETCSRCDYSTYAEIPALGHELVSHEAQAVTCLKIGWDAYETCSRCDYSTYAEIPALGHDLIGHEARVPTCTEIGWDAYETCSRCDYTTYAEIPANGHSFMDKVCIVCGADQPATRQWDVSLNGDGSVMAYAYAHMDGTYLLEILGSGPTTNNGYPFSVLSGKIEDIYIGDGVTTVGNRMFSGLRIQGSIQIPDSVTAIGTNAFYGFSGPKTVSLPASITSIGDFAFYGAKDLIVILQGDTLPASLGSIWDYNCGHYLQPQQVITTEAATYVIDRDGKAWLAKCYQNLPEFVAETSVNGVPVTGIGAFAFDQKSEMITYTVPAQITEIGSYAFRECNKLTVLFESTSYPAGFSGGGYYGPPAYLAPQKVIQMEDRLYVLDQNGQMYLARYFGAAGNVTVEAQVDGHPVQHIGAYAFSYRYSLQTVTLPDTIQTIGGYAFIHSTIKQISLPDSLTEIGTWGFFGADLTCVTIPENVVTIQSSAFSYCEYLKVVYVRSPVIAGNIKSTGSCGDLCKYAQTVVIPADADNTWLSETYAYREAAFVKGVDSVIYSNCAHDWQQTQVSEMVPCQSDGVERFACSGCTAEKAQITKCHDEISHDAKIPDCTQVGWDAYDACSRCDYTTYAELPALGHDPVSHEAQAPTCTESGWDAYKTCSRCDYTTFGAVPATGIHTFADADDTQCDVCGQVFILIRFDTNGGTEVEQCRRLPEQTATLGVSEKAGYRFVGWSATKNGEAQYGSGETACFSSSITLYAQWNKLCDTCEGTKIARLDCESCADGYVQYDITCPACLGAGLICQECDSITDCVDPQNHGIALCQECDNGKCHISQECVICAGMGYAPYTCTDCNEWGETIRTDGSAPDMPVLKRVEGSTVVLQAIDNGEYSLDGIHWQESPVFEDLQIGTQYCFYQRYAKTDTTLTGPASQALTVKLKYAQTAPAAPVLLDKTQDTVTLAASAGYEYSLDGVNWQSSGVFTGLSAETAYTFYQRIAETDTHYASQASAGLTVQTDERTYALGDINRDGKLTAFDAQILAEANAGLRILTEEQLALVGDLSPEDLMDYILGTEAA